MKIRYIISMSGAKSYPAFEKDTKGEFVFHDVDDIQAVRMVELERAVPKDQKEYDSIRANLSDLKAKKQAELDLAENIKNLEEMKARESELKSELKDLSAKIKEAELAIKGK